MAYIHLMSRSRLFSDVTRALRIAYLCNAQGLSTAEGLARARDADAARAATRSSRREWLKTVAHAGAMGAGAMVAAPAGHLFASQRQTALDVAIVGAGLSGLACADALAAKGVAAAMYDANTGAGGRCSSLRNFFPGQVAE